MLEIISAQESDMARIKFYAEALRLDASGLKPEDFLIAKINGTLAGFGRLKQHGDAAEIGTFAVVPDCREKKIGKIILTALIEKAPAEVYIITTIPEFCYPFGFKETLAGLPASILESKRKYEKLCKHEK